MTRPLPASSLKSTSPRLRLCISKTSSTFVRRSRMCDSKMRSQTSSKRSKKEASRKGTVTPWGQPHKKGAREETKGERSPQRGAAAVGRTGAELSIQESKLSLSIMWPGSLMESHSTASLSVASKDSIVEQGGTDSGCNPVRFLVHPGYCSILPKCGWIISRPPQIKRLTLNFLLFSFDSQSDLLNLRIFPKARAPARHCR